MRSVLTGETEGITAPECNVFRGRYRYRADLKALDACVRSDAAETELSHELRATSSPIRVEQWRRGLASHPDRSFAEYICTGLEGGFRIGFAGGSGLRSAQRNMGSARANAAVVQEYLEGEVHARRLVGPPPAGLRCHVSPFGVIPKPHQPGKWRLIVNLSAPDGLSVNDGISPELSSVHYARVDDAARLVLAAGRNARLAKLDLKSAYRMVPVHPADRPLLAVRWREEVWLDAALPFGLRSAPKIFSAVADALQWIMRERGVAMGIHYLDDFLFVGRADTSECGDSLRIALEACRDLGMPVALHKVGGPATVLDFLGIEIDSARGELRLPPAKLGRLRAKLAEAIDSVRWSRAWTKRELLSLIGVLHHAATVITPGRAFVRRLINLSRIPKRLHHRVRFSREAREDLEWWSAYADRWNGRGLIASLGFGPPRARLQTDASGSWGCGALDVTEGTWRGFAVRWSPKWREMAIAPKEMFPIVAALLLWGDRWAGGTLLVESDNSTVVAACNRGTSRDAALMRLVRVMQFALAHRNCAINAVHLPGEKNWAADALSRGEAHRLSSQVGKWSEIALPSEIVSALDELAESDPRWTSDSWRRLVGAI